MSPIKVAHITTIGMALRYLLLNQLRSIQQNGYEVVGISSPDIDATHIESAGIRHIPVRISRNFTPLADLISLWHLYKVLRQERFTIVHTHNPKPGLLGQLAARMAGVPIVINTLHGFYFHEHMNSLSRRFFIFMEKIAALCSDLILSQNKEDMVCALQERICSPKIMKHLGNGIDIRHFDRATVNEELLFEKRRAFQMTNGTPVVGFVGRLVSEKGILDLLAAARIILQRIPSVKFLIIGPIDWEKKDAITPDVADQYGVGHACVFTGLRQDMRDLYALMHVFALPTYREGFPRSPMEASAMRVPCVISDIRGCREAVEHARNGLLVPLGDVDAFAQAIIELLTNPERAGRMGEAGRHMALERFDEQLIFRKVKMEYARLLAERGFSVPRPASRECLRDEPNRSGIS